MARLTLEDLLKAGVHFGHRTSKRHPKMEPYIFAARDGVHIIDLQKTLDKLKEALEFISEVAQKGGVIIFVGTKKQAKKLTKEAAESCGMPYVNERWLGGTFTNFKTISSRIEKLKELEEKQDAGEFGKYTKKERLLKEREIERLETLVGGIRNLRKISEAVFLVDLKTEKNALKEARKKGVKIIAITDTNVNPELVDFPIPANDDAIKSLELIMKEVAETVKENYKGSIVLEKNKDAKQTKKKRAGSKEVTKKKDSKAKK